jgi:hypothetical protein
VCDIRELGGEIADALAGASCDVPAFRFDPSSVPGLPSSMTSGSVVVRRAHHDYNGCWRADALLMYATRQILRALGVVVVATLFAPPEHATDIALTHPATDIHTIRLKPPPLGPDLARGALWYDYRPRQWNKFPGLHEDVAPHDLPAVKLTSHDESGGITAEQWLARDTVVGFGSQAGVARFGQLLLDIGAPGSPGDEYHLEGEAGNRGVAPFERGAAIVAPGRVRLGAGLQPDLRLTYGRSMCVCGGCCGVGGVVGPRRVAG